MAQGTSYDFGFAAGSFNREDLEDIVVNISPVDAPLYTTSAKVPISHTTHEWIEDQLAAASAGALKLEGHAFSADTFQTRVRQTNITEIFGKDIDISNTQRALNPAGIADEYAYQIEIALKEIGRNIETGFFAITSSSTGDAATTARRFKTMNQFIHTGTAPTGAWTASSTAASGHAKADLDALLETIFIAGGAPDRVYMYPKGKTWYSRELAGLTSSVITTGFLNNTRTIPAGSSVFDANIDVYRSNFGTVQLVPDRFIPSGSSTATTTAAAANAGRIYVVESSKIQVGVLRPVAHYPLLAGGDSTRGMVLGELTLIVKAPPAHGKIWNVLDN